MKSLNKIYLVLTIIYFFSAKGYLEVSDTFYSVQTAQSIIERGELKLKVPSAKMYTIDGVGGAVYSKYGIGLAIYYIPYIFTAKCFSKITHLSETALIGYFISFANLPFMLLLLLVFVRILRYFKVNENYLPYILLCIGIGSIFWRYTVYDFSELQQSSLLLVTIYGLLINSKKSSLISGIAFSFLILLKVFSIIYLPCIVLFFLLCFLKNKKIQNSIAFAIPITIGLAILFYLNYIRFGNPLETGYGKETSDFVFKQLPRTIPALLFSIDKGLIFYCPMVIFAFLGWRKFFNINFNLALCIVLIIITNFFTTASWWSWYGGWSWGPRLLIPAIILWCIPISFWLKGEYSNIKRNLLLITAILGFVFQLPGILIKDQEIHHIKEMVFNLEEEKLTPTDYQTTCRLLIHKLNSTKEIYNGQDFGVPTKGIINLEQYDTYIGFNIWTEQLSRFLNKPIIRFFPILGVFLILLIVFWTRIKCLFAI